MTDVQPARCQKCGKPIGFVTVLAKGLTRFQQPVQNVKIVAICMNVMRKRTSDNVCIKMMDKTLPQQQQTGRRTTTNHD